MTSTDSGACGIASFDLSADAPSVWATSLVDLALALGPVSAWAAIRFVEQRRQLFTEASAYLRLRRRHRIRDALVERRHDVYRQVSELASLYSKMTTPDR